MLDPLPDFRVGEWVQKDARIATLIDPSSWQIKTYLKEGVI